VHVDPIKPTLKAPGTKRLKLKYDSLLSSFGFKFNSRRYTMAGRGVRILCMDGGGIRGSCTVKVRLETQVPIHPYQHETGILST